jgi:hypothetical protein
VDREIDPELFFLCRDPDPEDEVDDLDDDERGHDGVGDRRPDGEQLGEHLAGVAVDEALVVGLDGARRKDASRQCSEDAADTVDREDVEGVVDLDPLAEECRAVAEPAGCEVSVAAAAAVLVTMKALAARPFAATAEPALNPNQPNQRSPAPRTVIGMSWGSIRSPLATRRPIRSATIRADRPELAWTTVPPAKSRAPSLKSQPSLAQTQWAIGE